MKRIFFLMVVSASLLFVSCDDNKEARDLYNKAKELYNQGDYLRVKEVTDSIGIVDDNAFTGKKFAGHQLDKRSLSTTIGANYPDKIVVFYHKIDIFQQRNSSIGEVYITYFDKSFIHLFSNIPLYAKPHLSSCS